MKKLTAVLLLTAMTAGLAACGSNKGADTNTDTPAQNESTEEAVTTETSGCSTECRHSGNDHTGGSRKSGKIFYRASDPNV